MKDEKAELQAYRDRIKPELGQFAGSPGSHGAAHRCVPERNPAGCKVGESRSGEFVAAEIQVVAAKKPDGESYEAHIPASARPGHGGDTVLGRCADSTVARSDLRLPPPEATGADLPPTYKTSPRPTSPCATIFPNGRRRIPHVDGQYRQVQSREAKYVVPRATASRSCARTASS